MTISCWWRWFPVYVTDSIRTFSVRDPPVARPNIGHNPFWPTVHMAYPWNISLPYSVFCLFLVKNTFGLRFHFRLDRLLGQNTPLSLSLCALVTRLEISIAITASVYSLLLTTPNKKKINSLLVKVELFLIKNIRTGLVRIYFMLAKVKQPSVKTLYKNVYSKKYFLLFSFMELTNSVCNISGVPSQIPFLPKIHLWSFNVVDLTCKWFLFYDSYNITPFRMPKPRTVTWSMTWVQYMWRFTAISYSR